ncbi:MAG: DUF5615 family PIN-like protein [Cyanobacteria bacterium J06634_5]
MKLLFDHNLSPQLVTRFADLYPNSQHVFLLGIGETKDSDIWDYARQHGYIPHSALWIVTLRIMPEDDSEGLRRE